MNIPSAVGCEKGKIKQTQTELPFPSLCTTSFEWNYVASLLRKIRTPLGSEDEWLHKDYVGMLQDTLSWGD